MTEKIGKAALLIMGLAVGLCAAELALRWFVPVTSGFEQRMHRVPHRIRGWALEPGAAYDYRLPGVRVRVEYNSAGWRDREQDPVGGRATRIVILGDSFMEAYSVDLEGSFARRFESAARRRDLDAQTFNLGVGGYGTLQSLLAYREVAPDLAPDLVVLGFYVMNDLRDNSLGLESLRSPRAGRTYSRPFLRGDVDDWAITDVGFDEAMDRYRDRVGNRTRVTALESWSRVASLVGTTLRREGSSDSPATGLPPSAGPSTSAKQQLYRAGVHYCEEPPEVARAWATTRRILQRLADEVRGAGAEPVLFTVPAMVEVDRGAAARWVSELPAHELVCLDEAPGYERLAGLARALGIRLVDLLPIFRGRVARGGEDLFLRRDQHWSPAGHELAAESVFEGTAELIAARDH